VSRTPAKRRRAKAGVMGLEGWPGLQLPYFHGGDYYETSDIIAISDI
jgi:hypothetical protein